MKNLFIFALALLLFGCAEMQHKSAINAQQAEIDQYVKANLDRAKSGELPWSRYYTDVFDMFNRSNFSDRGFMMQTLVTIIEASKKYEDGNMTQEEFESAQMKMRADIAAYQDNRQLEYAKIRAMTPPPPAYTPPPPVYQPRRPVNCTSTQIGNSVHTNCY